jgi:hypothetical protein
VDHCPNLRDPARSTVSRQSGAIDQDRDDVGAIMNAPSGG